MHVSIKIDGVDARGRLFLTWAPIRGTLSLVDGPPSGMADVTLTAAGAAGLVFDHVRSDRGQARLALRLSTAAPTPFWVAGEFGRPSDRYGDVSIQVLDAGGAVLADRPGMVRVRKDATSLSPAERDRFLAALGALNAKGRGAYRDFREVHTGASDAEMHGNSGFLPWHRAFVLDVERVLQRVDDQVAVPYWRFDRAAPGVFGQDFMGEADQVGRVLFRPGHPLETWVTDGHLGVTRGLRFAVGGPANVMDEAATIALDGGSGAFGDFRLMEGDPHGRAHVSFDGPINVPATAVRDPLFFLLHSNVDRLWAKWQWFRGRHVPGDSLAYSPPTPDRVGHRLGDTMWPWNGVTVRPRPPTAPGGQFPDAPGSDVPGPVPTVASMLDFHAYAGGRSLGFSYDDVPFELTGNAGVPAAVADAG